MALFTPFGAGGRLLLAVTLLMLALAAHGQELKSRVEIDAPEPYRALLLQHLDIVKWRARLQRPEVFQRVAERTPRQIREIMATRGFFSAQVQDSLQQVEDTWVARYRVEPGEPSRVVSVAIGFEGAVSDDEHADRLQRLRSQWPLPAGAVFRQDEWDKGKALLLQHLQEDGFPSARVARSEARVNPERKEVAIVLELDSGPLFTFGELQIEGLQRYPASIIANLNRIAPGSRYSENALTELQTELANLPYFATVFVTADIDRARPDRVPVRVRVDENQTQKVGLGAGFSTNKGAGAEVQYEHKDLFDRGQVFRSVVKWEEREQTASASITLPPGASRYRWSFGTALQRTDVQDQISTKARFGIQRSRAEGKIEKTQGLELQIERREVGDRSDNIEALSPIFSWTKRDVDDPIYPRRGYLFNAQLNAGARELLSDRNFVRLYGKGAAYLPLAPDGTLILRGEAGQVFARSRNGIPTTYLFRTGGSTTVRGYAFESLGVDENGAVVGGRYLAVASAEYLHFFTTNWGGAVFFDAGNATDSRTNFALRRGYGFGVRWRSPVGPLGIDLAHGEQDNTVRLHFAFGITF